MIKRSAEDRNTIYICTRGADTFGRSGMERPHNPYRKGGIAFDVMESSLQGEYDGLPGIDDLTTEEIAEVLGTNRKAIANAILNIKHKTGYVVKYVKMVGGRKKQKCEERYT